MTKYCKCGHKKTEHSTTDTNCNGGIYHHHDLMGTELDDCSCQEFRLSNYQKYHAKRWKNTIVYDKTRGIVPMGSGKVVMKKPKWNE